MKQTELEKRAAAMRRDIRALLISLKPTIGNSYRSPWDENETRPNMQVTIGAPANLYEWAYQTGDNSYSGGAYCFPYWGVITLYRRSNCRALADDAINQILEQSEYERENIATAVNR